MLTYKWAHVILYYVVTVFKVDIPLGYHITTVELGYNNLG